MFHPYTQIEIIRSFQEEKRRELLKLRRTEGKRGQRSSLLARVLYASGGLLISAGHTLKRQVEPQYSN